MVSIAFLPSVGRRAVPVTKRKSRFVTLITLSTLYHIKLLLSIKTPHLAEFCRILSSAEKLMFLKILWVHLTHNYSNSSKCSWISKHNCCTDTTYEPVCEGQTLKLVVFSSVLHCSRKSCISIAFDI